MPVEGGIGTDAGAVQHHSRRVIVFSCGKKYIRLSESSSQIPTTETPAVPKEAPKPHRVDHGLLEHEGILSLHDPPRSYISRKGLAPETSSR